MLDTHIHSQIMTRDDPLESRLDSSQGLTFSSPVNFLGLTLKSSCLTLWRHNPERLHVPNNTNRLEWPGISGHLSIRSHMEFSQFSSEPRSVIISMRERPLLNERSSSEDTITFAILVTLFGSINFLGPRNDFYLSCQSYREGFPFIQTESA